VRRKSSKGTLLRRSSAQGSFEAINITPFTDVLLVLLIIFLIAGSSLTETGLPVEKLSKTVAETMQGSEEMGEQTVFVQENGALSIFVDGQLLNSADLEVLEKDRAVYLLAQPDTKVGLLIPHYDRLLGLGFSNVLFSQPGPPPGQ
jgi:biopolymer transport protein ExbD